MKTTRRGFLKGLLATAGAAILAPQALVEKVHGASDLTPRERDIAADVMGLRQEQWAGWKSGLSEFITYPMYEGPGLDGRAQFGEITLPRSMPEAERWDLVCAGRAHGDSIRARWVGEDDAPFVVEPGMTIVGVDSAARPSFSWPPFGVPWSEIVPDGPDLDDSMVQSLLHSGYTPMPNYAPEYATPQWLVEELRKRA